MSVPMGCASGTGRLPCHLAGRWRRKKRWMGQQQAQMHCYRTVITETSLALCSPMMGKGLAVQRQSSSHWWALQLFPALGKERRVYPSLPPHPDFFLTWGWVFQLTTAPLIQTIPEDHPSSCQQNTTGLVALMQENREEGATTESGPNFKSL